MTTDNATDFAVYVHWPFCEAKCPYCDFNSHVRREIDETAYLDACLAELAHMAALAPGRAVESVFFGGGTPSLMSPATVGALLDGIAGLWPVAGDVEVTLEANPSSVEAARFAGYRAAGVNRVSLGIQALNDADLRALGRLHTASEALDALEIAIDRFERVSFDLIYARPGQTPAEWARELTQALARAVGHVSLYQLTIEPETPFAALHAAGKLKVPDDAAARALYEVTQEVTDRAGLPAYEVSNHARPGEECRHNLIYWRAGEYAGAGPGAHGRLDIGGTRHALATLRPPEAWRRAVEARGHGIETETPLSQAERTDEVLLMGLRLSEGLDLRAYERVAGQALDTGRMQALQEAGLVERTDTHLRVTDEGRPVLEAIIRELAGS